ncbi:MAG: SDR family oxidoreductase [Elusimicrobiota bacterium]
MSKRYLVTGGAGFIGSHICDYLVKAGARVRVLDNFCAGKMEYLADIKNKIEIQRGDIRNIRDVRKAVKNVDYIFHEAALRSVPRSIDNPVDTNDVNITGTLNVLIAARDAGVKRLVYAASSSAYGDSKLLPKRETHLPAPISPYAVAKLTGEYYCRTFSKTFGLETIALRYFNVFGPRQSPESAYAAVVPKFIEWALEGKPIQIHGDGKQSRDFTFIDNVVLANILAMRAKHACGEVYNVACNERYTVLQIAQNIGRILGKKLEYKFLPARAGDVKHTQADISAIKRALGYKPKVGFVKGMEITVKSFL